MRKLIIITIIIVHLITLIASMGGIVCYTDKLKIIRNILKKADELFDFEISWAWHQFWWYYSNLWDSFIMRLFYKLDHSILYFGFGIKMPSDSDFVFGGWRPHENAYDQMLRYFFGLSFVYSCGLIFLEIIIYTLIKKFIKIYKKVKNIYPKKYSKCY
jgi:hypothetical protein